MGHNRKLVLSGVALTHARNNRYGIGVMEEILDELEPMMISTGFFARAPFRSNRRPDAQIVDKDRKARKVFEAERNPNSKRNKGREAEYDDLGLEHETHPVEPPAPPETP